VEAIDELDRRVTLDRVVHGDTGRDESLHPFLRRWDHVGEASELVDGALELADAGDDDLWLELEDGVQVQFAGGPYRSGDFWLIPARVETGDVIWPLAPDGSPSAELPAGPTFHYAPLALIGEQDLVDLRCLFEPIGCAELAAEAPQPKPAPQPPEPPPQPPERPEPKPRPRRPPARKQRERQPGRPQPERPEP
jgi:hypothetical protein